jgi:thymidylate kinase
MLIKLNPIFSAYARHREEKIERVLTRQQWIIADRVLMIALFASVVILAIAFS